MAYLASFFFIIATLSSQEALEIGRKVWQNECAGTIEGLTSWNNGEEFASLGIGHFIWYPENAKGPFVETFPELVQFCKSQGASIPIWIEHARGCPWKNQADFRKALQTNSKQMGDLRSFLQTTILLQAQFLQVRLERALPELFAFAGKEKKSKIEALYRRIYAQPNGPFAILDYVNFKGYGTSPNETYDGLGWGLYQVLENIPDRSDEDLLVQFVASAKKILKRRIEHAPKKNEERFLKGWFRRLEGYLPEEASENRPIH